MFSFEGLFIYPLDEGSVVVGFEAMISSQIITVQIKDKTKIDDCNGNLQSGNGGDLCFAFKTFLKCCHVSSRTSFALLQVLFESGRMSKYPSCSSKPSQSAGVEQWCCSLMNTVIRTKDEVIQLKHSCSYAQWLHFTCSLPSMVMEHTDYAALIGPWIVLCYCATGHVVLDEDLERMVLVVNLGVIPPLETVNVLVSTSYELSTLPNGGIRVTSPPVCTPRVQRSIKEEQAFSPNTNRKYDITTVLYNKICTLFCLVMKSPLSPTDQICQMYLSLCKQEVAVLNS